MHFGQHSSEELVHSRRNINHQIQINQCSQSQHGNQPIILISILMILRDSFNTFKRIFNSGRITRRVLIQSIKNSMNHGINYLRKYSYSRYSEVRKYFMLSPTTYNIDQVNSTQNLQKPQWKSSTMILKQQHQSYLCCHRVQIQHHRY